MSTYEWLSVIVGAFTALVGLGAAYFVWQQLENLVEQVKLLKVANEINKTAAETGHSISKLSALLTLEGMMITQEARYGEANVKVASLKPPPGTLATPGMVEEFRIAKLRVDLFRSIYLNT